MSVRWMVLVKKSSCSEYLRRWPSLHHAHIIVTPPKCNFVSKLLVKQALLGPSSDYVSL